MAREDLLFGKLFDSCPETWDIVPFEEAIDFQEGPGIMAVDFHDNGVPLIRLSGVQRRTVSLDGCNFLDPVKVAKKWSHFKLKRGDLLISTSATIGMVSEVGPDAEGAVAYTGLIRLRPRTDRVFPSFIKQFAASSFFVQQAEGMAAGSVMRHFGPSHLRQMAFPIPPLPEQKAIARILGTLDDKIELNRRMNATLEAMARALFQSWFVDFDPVHAKAAGGQPSGMDAATAGLFPAGFQDSALGKLPDGWEVCKLKAVTSKIGSGATPRGGREVYVDEGPALIRSQNVYDHEFTWDGLVRLSGKSASELRNVEVMKNDVLFNITGDSILRTCIVDPSVLPARVNQHVAIIRADQTTPARYLHLYLVQPSLKSFLIGLSAGATRHAITKGQLESIDVPRPPSKILDAFDKLTSPWFAQIDSNRAQSRTLATLRDTLLPKLLSGEFPVNELNAAAL